jgi:hypothetical protein
MNDSSQSRPVLKLKLKPAILETLNNKLPKPLITVSNEIKTQAPRIDKPGDNKLKDQTGTKPKPQAIALITKKDSLDATAQGDSKDQNSNKNKEPKQKPKAKDKIVTPPPPKLTYDFFEIYHKLHTPFREVISLKNPVALAIGIKDDIRTSAGISKNCSKQWTAEYLRRSKYYKKAHIVGANRYNLQGEIAGVITQEECDARQAMFKNFKSKNKT